MREWSSFIGGKMSVICGNFVKLVSVREKRGCPWKYDKRGRNIKLNGAPHFIIVRRCQSPNSAQNFTTSLQEIKTLSSSNYFPPDTTCLQSNLISPRGENV